MTCSLQKTSAVLTFVSLQFVALATLLGQSSTDQVSAESFERAVPTTSRVRFSFSDSILEENPLRGGSASNRNAPLRSTSATSWNRGTGSPTVRQVRYQEDLNPAESIDEPQTPGILDESDSDDSSQSSIDDVRESAPKTRPHVRSPISNNPFANARQDDPQGLLNKTAGVTPKFVVEKYSDISGRERSYQLAGYNAHRLHHNPLYFEDRNLERYGNELDFQRGKSAVKFFFDAAILPARLIKTPACSRVTTLGLRRPGELVPYRHYEQCASDSRQFYSNQQPQRITHRR